MKILMLLAFSLLSVTASFSAKAGPYSDALASCLADNTSGKERKELARWVFVAMAAHPDMKSLSNVSAADREHSSKAVAALFTRLVTENCATLTKGAMQNEGADSIGMAFKTLGGLAMQELMTNQDVKTAMSLLERFIDRSKLNSLMSSK